MARGINKVILIGNMGNDPELRYMPNGGAVCNISVATSEGWRDKQSGEVRERTEWHRVVLYNRTAEVAGQYLHKGSKVYIEGRLQTRKWTGNDGQDRYTTEIIANDLQMLDSKQGGASGNYAAPASTPAYGHSSTSQSSGGYQSTPSTSQQHAAPDYAASHMDEPVPELDGFNDDVPF